ncbi:MAG: DUF1934 domain-containing protein [Sporomusaceae bacterium]|nr:DUF1934 domain-containing protein [Sporomusaceae bacterium]
MQAVIVKVTGTQQGADGEIETIELTATGSCRRQNGTTYITYKEELTGLDGASTLLKLYPNHICLVRLGAYQQKQEFIPGRKTYSNYVTPHGSLMLGVTTRSLAFTPIDENDPSAGQTVAINYELEVEGQWQSSNTLRLSFTKA